MTLSHKGISEEQFTALFFATAKQKFSSLHVEMAEKLSSIFGLLIDELPILAQSSHRKSLSESLTPPLRIEKLRALEWRVYDPSSALVLPDCVAVAFDRKGEVHPMMLADFENLEAVLMPLSTNRLLIGTCNTGKIPETAFNDAFSGCSWDFFVARDRSAELERLRGLLRTRVYSVIDDQVRSF